MLSEDAKPRYRRVLEVLKWVLLGAGAMVLGPPLLASLYFLLAVRHLREGETPRIQTPMRSGSVVVDPPCVVAGGPPVEIDVTYRVGPGGVERGGAVRLCPGKVLRFEPWAWRLTLQWGNGWGALQRRNTRRANFVAVEAPGSDARLEVELMGHMMFRSQLSWFKRKFLQRLGRRLPPFDPRDAFLERQKLTVRVAGGRLAEGDALRFRLGAGAGLEVPYDWMDTDLALEVDGAGDGSFRLEEAVPHILAVGGRPAALEVVVPTLAPPGQRVMVLVRCVDERGVLAPSFAGPLKLAASGPLEVPGTVLVPEGGEGVARCEAAVTGTGVARVRALAAGGVVGESNPLVCREGGTLLLWGDPHTHSVVSDGTQEPRYCYHRARHLMGWDFLVVTDHDTWSLAEERPRTREEFALMMSAAEEGYVPGELVTFQAYEWTHHVLGHRNVLFGPGETPVLLPTTDERYAVPAGLYEGLVGRDVTVIPHHPAWKTHAGEMRYDYGPTGNPLARLVEVYSTHGNSECPGCPRPISHSAFIEGWKGKAFRAFLGTEHAGSDSGSYVRDALAAGHRLALVAGSDGHLVATDPHRGVGIIYGGGITGLFAGAVTREAAWQALTGRRVCATTGARMLLELSADGCPQGGETTASDAPRIQANVVGTGELALVEVVRFDSEAGYSAAWQGGGGVDALEIDFTDAAFKRDTFYYLRVEQADGHLGWAGPVWVDKQH